MGKKKRICLVTDYENEDQIAFEDENYCQEWCKKNNDTYKIILMTCDKGKVNELLPPVVTCPFCGQEYSNAKEGVTISCHACNNIF